MLAPLIRLANALCDLDEGIIAPLLKPAQCPPHRPPGNSKQRTVKILAAAAMDILMRRAGMNRRDAARGVADVLLKHDVPVGRGNTLAAAAHTVARWRFVVGAEGGQSDAGRFADRWAAQTAALGWSVLDVFGGA